MNKTLLAVLFLFISFSACAQIQVSKMLGKNGEDTKIGFGAFLKFGYPVSEAAAVTLEGGANIFQSKDDPAYGWITVPVKAGFRYTLNQTGAGFYLEPQVGYNVYGIDIDDNKFTGLVVAGGVGYLFQPGGRIQLDLGLLYESALHKGGAANYVSLRLTHNFSLGRRNTDY